MILLFLTGAPNSGKSTLTTALLKAGHVQRAVEPGKWLRGLLALRDLDHPSTANDLSNYIGNNFSNDVLGPLVNEYVEMQLAAEVRAEGEARGTPRAVVIEGYPRTREESEHVMKMSQSHAVQVVHLNIEMAEALRRGSKRKRDDGDAAQNLEHRCAFWVANEREILEPCRSKTESIDVNEMDLVDVMERVAKILAELPPSPTTEPKKERAPSPSTPSSFWKEATAIQSAEIVQMQLRLSGCSKRRRQFCGSHPVSLDRPNMPRLLRYPYLCALKIDGCRYFCLIRNSRLWFMNRKLSVWAGPHDERLAEFNDTLLDGELTLDNLFIVIDVLNVANTNVMRRPIMERFTFAARLGQMLRHTPFHLRAQEYVHRTHLKLLLERASQMPFKTDGVIFQPEKLPVRLGIDYNLFKYKDAKDNTVDLLLGEDGALYCRKTSDTTEDDDTLTLDVNSGVILTKVSVGQLHPDHRGGSVWLKPGTVAEFSPLLVDWTCPTASPGEAMPTEVTLYWVPKRPRWDKHFPNMDWVVANILKSIEDNITMVELVEFTSRPPLARSKVPSPPPRRRLPADRPGPADSPGPADRPVV